MPWRDRSTGAHPSRVALVVAAGAGLVHAAISAYWGLGGTWLLETLGERIVGNVVLLGMVQPDGGYDRPAMVGHAWLWDPLFLVWGLALLTGLVLAARAEGPPVVPSDGVVRSPTPKVSPRLRQRG